MYVNLHLIFIETGQRERSPYSHKLCARVSIICGNRQLQQTRSAMSLSRLDRKEFLIAYTIAPGKYALLTSSD